MNIQGRIPRSAHAAQGAPSTMSGWVWALDTALKNQSVDTTRLMHLAGMGHQPPHQHHGRYTLAQVTRFWELAFEATGDHCLGLKVTAHVSPSTFQDIGLALLSAPSVRDMLTRLLAFASFVYGGASLREEVANGKLTIIVECSQDHPRPPWIAVDAMVSLIASTCRLLHGPGLKPLQVRLQRPRPPFDASRFSRAFQQAPVAFRARDNALVYDLVTVNVPLRPHQTGTAIQQDLLTVARFQAATPPACLVTQVNDLLMAMMPNREPSQAQVAQALHISPRSLQRHLAQKDTTYRAVLQATRLAQAMTLLGDSSLPILEVADRLGFRDASTFTHAFRRWTSLTPSQWRKMQAEKEKAPQAGL